MVSLWLPPRTCHRCGSRLPLGEDESVSDYKHRERRVHDACPGEEVYRRQLHRLSGRTDEAFAKARHKLGRPDLVERLRNRRRLDRDLPIVTARLAPGEPP